MHERKNKDMSGRLLDMNQLCSYLNLGRDRAVEFAEMVGARVKLWKCTRFDRVIIDEALNRMREGKNAEGQAKQN